MIPTFLDTPVIFGYSLEVYIICLFIVVASFYFWKRLFKQLIKANRTRTVVAFAASLAATPFLYLGLIKLFIYAITYTPSRPFNESDWSTNVWKRYQMATDIIQNRRLIGKDSNQVKQLLGNPTWRSDTTYQAELRNAWFYGMGTGGGGLGFMIHTLIVKFEHSKVVAVEHGKAQD